MIRSLLSAAVLSAALVGSIPAFAADCATDMKMTEDMMMKSTDATKKSAAMKEMTMAKEMMTKKDEAGCMKHIDAAKKAIM